MADRSTRKRISAELDSAHFGWFHVKAILIAGVGFYTDAYDLFIIGIAKPMMAIVYYPQLNGKLAVSDDLWVTGVALVGALIGQLTFGFLGDYLGRKKVYLVTLIIMICGTVGQCFAASTVKGIGFVTELCIWRFVLGVGIGGDYPLSATIATEYSPTKWRGAFVASVFAMQGLGILSAALVSIITIRCFKDAILYHDINYLDYVWRIIIGFSAIPTILTIYLRSQLPETPRFSTDVEQDDAKAMQNVRAAKSNEGVFIEDYTPTSKMNRISARGLSRYLTYPSILHNRNFWVLIGTASTWFLLDIAYYSQNLFLPNILEGIGYNPSIALPAAKCMKMQNCPHYSLPVPPFDGIFTCKGKCAEQVYDKVFKTAAGNAITACMGTVPGYWFTIAFVDTIGRINIQYMGFGVMTSLLIILAAGLVQIKAVSIWLFIVLYALTFFFANFGPNATTFITPVEVFITKYRSTLHGVSAACGKAGAVVGAFGFGQLFLVAGISTTLGLLAFTNFIGKTHWVKFDPESSPNIDLATSYGLCCTIFVPETKRMHLDDAALHSISHFGILLAYCKFNQVNPAIEDDKARIQVQPAGQIHGVRTQSDDHGDVKN